MIDAVGASRWGLISRFSIEGAHQFCILPVENIKNFKWAVKKYETYI